MNCKYKKALGNKNRCSLQRNKSQIPDGIFSNKLLHLNDVSDLKSDSCKNMKKKYSRSISISDYVPLTKKQKLFIIKEIDSQSDQHLNKYSSIFNEIKQHITDINESLSSGSFIELITPTNCNRNHININFPLIHEVQEEYNNSSKKPIPNDESILQTDDLDEGKKVIVINQSGKANSLTNNKLKIQETRKQHIKRAYTFQESFSHIKIEKKENNLTEQDYERQETAATQLDNIHIQYSENDTNMCQCIIY